MAKIGLKYFVYGKLVSDEETGRKYETPAKLAGAIESKFTPTTISADLYSDDELSDSMFVVSGGKLTLGVDDDDDTVFAGILGNTISEVTIGSKKINQVVSNSNDEADFYGFGQVVPKRVNGVTKYKAEFFSKVKFEPYDSEAKTSGEKLEYATPSVTGSVFKPKDGNYKYHATCDSEADAKAYLASLFVPASATNTDASSKK